MEYMNVNLTGLRGKHHPSLASIVTVEEVRKIRPLIKFLVGDYLTYQIKFDQTGQGNPLCKLCRTENETICHLISICPKFNETRSRIIQQISEVCEMSRSNIDLEPILQEPKSLTQFILDPTSFNLKERIHMNDPIVTDLFRLSRHFCYAIHSDRIRHLKSLSEETKTS